MHNPFLSTFFQMFRRKPQAVRLCAPDVAIQYFDGDKEVKEKVVSLEMYATLMKLNFKPDESLALNTLIGFLP
jgi:hypothetical protein